MTTKTTVLSTLKTKMLVLRLAEIVLFALAAGSAMLAILRAALSLSITSAAIISIITIITVFIGLFFFYGLQNLNEKKVASFLNFNFPGWEFSSELLLQNEEVLAPVELAQRRRIEKQIAALTEEVKVPHRLGAASIVFTVSLALYFLPEFSSQTNSSLSAPLSRQANKKTPVKLDRWEVDVVPPAYTGLSSLKVKASKQLKVVAGSKLTWSLFFSAEPERIFLFRPGRDTLWRKPNENNATLTLTTEENFIYQLGWVEAGKAILSDYFSVQAEEDRAPEIELPGMTQFTELKSGNERRKPVKAVLGDDFGLTQGYLIATVSKGSGESVKFREETIPFHHPKKIIGKKVNAVTTIDLKQLGLEPGDELYFYVEARDNKRPRANVARTETFFIALADTSQTVTVDEEGLGVDLMPEYFRSQRQIIIDSEKILALKKQRQISTQQFNTSSNELGYDQKVLRLRYGQFLGEEFETNIGGHLAESEHAEDEQKDLTQQFGHQHDHESEHQPTEQQQTTSEDHRHSEHEENGKSTSETPWEAFVHSHDNEEEATFFIRSIKAKLKAALTLMWDAELHLRMYDPARSLPYQYKILKLLKEISNDSRIYVHRTGFDPPPLKEEKRLTGDQSEILNPSFRSTSGAEQTDVSISEAITLLQEKQQSNLYSLSTAELQTLQRAGNLLAQAAVEQPSTFLPALSVLRTIMDGKLSNEDAREGTSLLTRALWMIQPVKDATPSGKGITLHTLDEQVIQQLENVNPR